MRGCEKVFELACKESFPRLYVRPLHGKTLKMAEQLVKDVPIGHAGRVLVTVVRNWADFVCFAVTASSFNLKFRGWSSSAGTWPRL